MNPQGFRRLTEAERRRYVPANCPAEDRERVWAQWAAFMARPPMGPPRLPTSLQSPRTHRKQSSAAARQERRERAWSAYVLRTQRGLTIAQVRAELGVCQGTAAQWLKGVEAGFWAPSEIPCEIPADAAHGNQP